MKPINFIFSLIFLSNFLTCGRANKLEKEQTSKSLTEKVETLEKDIKTGIEGLDKAKEAAEKMNIERRKRGDTLATPYQDLQKFLPNALKGYILEGNMRGESINMQGISYSKADAEYKKGKWRMSIELHDYNQAPQIYQGLAMVWSMNISQEDKEKKSGTITWNGHKGWEEWNKKSKEAKILLGINDRFFLELRADNQENTDFLKSIIESIDIETLAKR